MARPSKYYTHVQPYFKEIQEALERGCNEKDIAKELGVGTSAWCDYKNKFTEFADLIKGADRSELLKDLENALIKRAMGFEYEEKVQTQTDDEEKGRKIQTQIITRYQPPDTTAIFGALNRFDPNYKKDAAYYDLKKQELELRKEIAKSQNFDLEI